jgi:hypothetical protein
VLIHGVLGRLLEAEVQCRPDLEAAEEGLAGAVLVDQLLAQPGGEVGGLGVDLGRLDVGGGGHGGADPLGVLLFGYVALVEHLREHLVAALLGGYRVQLRVVGGGRGDDSGQHRRLLGQQH